MISCFTDVICKEISNVVHTISRAQYFACPFIYRRTALYLSTLQMSESLDSLIKQPHMQKILCRVQESYEIDTIWEGTQLFMAADAIKCAGNAL